MRFNSLCIGVLLAGCSASVTGNPFGTAFGAATAVATRTVTTVTSAYTVTISNRELSCGRADGGVEPDGTQLLLVGVAKNGNELPAARGEAYLHNGASEFSTVYGCLVSDGRCRLASASESSVTMTQATETKVVGTFKAVFAGAEISGNFDATACF